MKLIELHEEYAPLLPSGGKGMDEVAKDLLYKDRAIAERHGLTIDGGMNVSASGKLPVTRKNYILQGGALIPKGGIKGEEKQTKPFEQRVHAYVKDLWEELLKKLLVRSLNNDLETDYDVRIQTLPTINMREVAMLGIGNAGHWTSIEKTTPEKVIENMLFGKERRGLPYCVLTWMIHRNTPATK